MTIEIHHLERVADGGGNDAANLLPLCPMCHERHHRGQIPASSLRTWKHLLITLNAAYDRASVDTLLVLQKLGSLAITADGLIQRGGLVASGLIEITKRVNGAVAGVAADILTIRLSPRGQAFVQAWLAGKEAEAYGEITLPAPTVSGIGGPAG